MHCRVEFKIRRVGDRIEAALGERPAAQQPLESEPCAAPRTVLRNRFLGIHGTRRIKFAVPSEERRKKRAVHTHAKQQHRSRHARSSARRRYVPGVFAACGKVRSSSVSIAANFAVPTEVRGCMTMSHPGAISWRCSRSISRIRLRIRLRVTATPSAFLTLRPNRLMSRPLERKKTVNDGPERRLPSR